MCFYKLLLLAIISNKKYDCKLGGKSVQVSAGGMGLQVFSKKGTPTTYIYQTLLGWTQTDNGFEVDTADGKLLEFQSSTEIAAEILEAMSKHALKLAKAVTANQLDAPRQPVKPIKLDSMQSVGSGAVGSTSPEEVVPFEDRKIHCKLGGKSVQVSCGGMGLQVFPKRGPPTTYIYQTLLGWMSTDAGFELNMADGQTLMFECASPDEGKEVIRGISAAARALAKAQQDADRAAGVDLNDTERIEEGRKAKALALAQAAKGELGAHHTAAAPHKRSPEEAVATLPLAEDMTKYDCKLSGKSVQVAAGGMGLQVYAKKGVGAPTTYIYQTLKGWNLTDRGVDVETVDGKHLLFAVTHDGDADKLLDEITDCAQKLALAQRQKSQVEHAALATQEPIPASGAESQSKQTVGTGDVDQPSIPKTGLGTAIEHAETHLQSAVAVSDTVSWRQSLCRGGDLAWQWGADERAFARPSPLIEELVLALPPVALAGTRSSPTPRVADLCAGAGFAASVTCVAHPCGDGVALHNGGQVDFPASELAYDNDLNCMWTLSCPGVSVPLVTFTSFEVGDPSDEEDFVAAYNGESSDAERLARLSGTYEASAAEFPEPLEFSTGTGLLEFNSGPSGRFPGFEATVTCVTHPCAGDGEVIAGGGSVDYPPGDGNYLGDKTCKWILTCQDNSVPLVTFTDFATELGYDFVNAYDGISTDSDRVARMSGDDVPGPILFRSSEGLLEFSSDQSVAALGFEANVGCVSPVIIGYTSFEESTIVNVSPIPIYVDTLQMVEHELTQTLRV